MTTDSITLLSNHHKLILPDYLSHRRMYWTDWGTVAKIERASMDGTSRTVLHSTNLVWPNALTLDYSSQTLYWMDASLDKLESSSVNGFNRRLLSRNSRIQHPFGITIYQSVLYWTDWQSNSILSARVTSPGTVSTVLSGLLLDPMGIHVVSLDRQPTGMAAPAVSFTVAVVKSIYLCFHGICCGIICIHLISTCMLVIYTT